MHKPRLANRAHEPRRPAKPSRSALGGRQVVQQVAPDRLLTQVEVAERLRVAPRTLEHWRYEGRGPSFVRISPKIVRYRESVIEQYIAEREQGLLDLSP
jgi:predicted DNA-binding transcriptional regulator AlpA